MTALLDPVNWVVLGATFACIGACVALHYGVLLGCAHVLPAISRRRPPRVLLLIFIVVFIHAVEIWLFAVGYAVLCGFEAFGAIHGTAAVNSILDYAYFSGTVYSTVGFGDMVPVGAIRFMVGMEALTGLVMITWSASFTFLQMERDWPE